MNKKNLLLIMGFSIISACASNEASMDADVSKAAAVKDEPVAAMDELKTDVLVKSNRTLSLKIFHS